MCLHSLHCQVVGASGIVFGLMGLYAGDVLLNFRSLTLPWLRLLWVTASCIYFIVSSVLQVRQPVAGMVSPCCRACAVHTWYL